MEVPKDQTHRYGIVDISGNHAVEKVQSIVEKPAPGTAPSNFAVVGRYVLDPAIFDLLEKAQPGKGGEIQLTDSLQELNKRNSLLAYRFEGRRHDAGDKLGFIEATIDFALEREGLGESVRRYMLERLREYEK